MVALLLSLAGPGLAPGPHTVLPPPASCHRDNRCWAEHLGQLKERRAEAGKRALRLYSKGCGEVFIPPWPHAPFSHQSLAYFESLRFPVLTSHRRALCVRSQPSRLFQAMSGAAWAFAVLNPCNAAYKKRRPRMFAWRGPTIWPRQGKARQGKARQSTVVAMQAGSCHCVHKAAANLARLVDAVRGVRRGIACSS